jgi:hypothetical protein
MSGSGGSKAGHTAKIPRHGDILCQKGARVSNGVVFAAVVAGGAEGAADEAVVGEVDKGADGLLDSGGVEVCDVIGWREGL